MIFVNGGSFACESNALDSESTLLRPSTFLSLLTVVPFDAMGKYQCFYACGKKVNYNGNACRPCAIKAGKEHGDFTGKAKESNDKNSACPSKRARASSGASPKRARATKL